ncbi:hypothetical protein [Spiroplasma diminutum]|uniref:Uncharacterized protein n=1 Tax=Spiroplasma diminutum CUAS-1 TaxID=1276221 RepID=S5M1C9_9MOLU|nr:hypothetical protein [Spiroplasma diminutum]AGR41847.1 hypothetical protein SDIMI_v3c01430 [Spiroplasma diminutum CUAS-1]
MSMTAEEILINCEKQFSFIKKDIDVLIKYIKELLVHCNQIDNSGFYQNQINELLEKINKEQIDLAQNTYERELSSDTHVAIETYHEIQRYAERKRESIADFKAQVYSFKRDVLIKEQENILKSLDKNSFDDLEIVRNDLIAKYKDDEDKILIRNIFDQNHHYLINFRGEKLYNFIFEKLKHIKASNKSISKEIIAKSIDLYSEDRDLVEAIRDESQLFMNLDNNGNFQENAKQYFIKSSKLAEQEAVRKDNVIKIVKAIREVGYVVNEENIRRIQEKNMILIHGEKLTGETADFAVKLDGSFVYNWEGFEGHEHDEDAQAFLNKLKEFNLHSSDEFNKQYREPKYIAKNKQIFKNKNNSNSNSNR